MKIMHQKKIFLFKIKNDSSNFNKLLFLHDNTKKNLIFFVLGFYFKVFFDLGLNLFGTIPQWFYKISGFVHLREFSFFKVFSRNKKFSRILKYYTILFNNLIKKTKIGYFLEFKVVGYFRAKRISIKKKNKININSNKNFVNLYLGYSHLIFINLINNVFFVRGKKRFMFFTSNKQEFEKIIRQIFFYKPFNVYKIKGIRTPLNVKKMKPGKQKQQKKALKK